MSSSVARGNVCSSNAVAGELSRLFSPVFYVKKDDLDPFVSLLNGIKHRYWDKPEKFHLVIGLLHQLKLDTSTQVSEYQQGLPFEESESDHSTITRLKVHRGERFITRLNCTMFTLLIKNRLGFLLQDSPDLKDTLFKIIADASNNTSHVLNARPVSVGLQSKGQIPALRPILNPSSGPTPQTFIIRNNTVPMSWQPWFAHLVPKASAGGRTVLRLQPGRLPCSFLVPKSPASLGSVQRVVKSPTSLGAVQRVVTSSGLMAVHPQMPMTAVSLVNGEAMKQTTSEFGVSRKLYEKIPTSVQSTQQATSAQQTRTATDSSSDVNKQALLKKQQEFLKQLALLKTEKASTGCSKELFPAETLPTNAGDNSTRQTAIMTRSGNYSVRNPTRQSSASSVHQSKVKKKKMTPRTKGSKGKKTSNKDVQDTLKKEGGKEKGLLLSRVGEHCIVVSIPEQASGNSGRKKSKSKSIPKGSSPPTSNSEQKKKKHKKKKKHSKRKNDDISEKAFDRVKKLHKKRHKAFMKALAQTKGEETTGQEVNHREVAAADRASLKTTIKISPGLFKRKGSLNENNSCSASGMKTPRKRKHNDQNTTPDLSSLISPSCFVSLKKMKLDKDGDIQTNDKTQVQYKVEGGSSFPYMQEMTIHHAIHHEEMMSSQESYSIAPLDPNLVSDGESSLGYGSQAYSQDEYDAPIDICGIDDSSTNMQLTSIDTKACHLPGSFYQGAVAAEDASRCSYIKAYSAHSFLGRLLISPSPPKSQQKRTRVRHPRPLSSKPKVRKSKRQKRR